MAFKIAIASGKGGTGKTTVSVNLFRLLYERLNGKIQLVDCDVEEPNDLIFFDQPELILSTEVNQQVPFIDKDKCTFCRKCSEYCEFNAIVVIPPVKFAEVNKSLCHSCGACSVACEFGAITEYPETIGVINTYKNEDFEGITEGRLKVGSAMQTMLIKALKKRIVLDNDVIIFDAPPGTSCSVVETISDADYLVLVTEPTPFGLHDFKLMVQLVKDLNLKAGVIINKSGIGNRDIYDYIEQQGIELLGEIPFDRDYAKSYSEGQLMESIPAEIAESYEKIQNALCKKLIVYEGANYFKW